MHEHCSCKYGEKSWREDASLFNTIIVYGISLVSSLSTKILTVMSRCKHFRIATNWGGVPFCHYDPQSIAVHGVKRFGEIEVTVLLSGLLHKLSDGEDHIRRATVSSKAAL